MPVANGIPYLPGDFSQVLGELKHALHDLSTEEMLEIFARAASAAAKVTVQKKVRAFKDTGKFLSKTFNRYKSDGVQKAMKEDYNHAKTFVINLPDKARHAYESFRGLSRERQIEEVAILLLTLAIFFAAAGGFDVEGGIPDLDIQLGGIGHHRSIITHSIIIGFGFEFACRFGVALIERIRDRLPNHHHQAWDKVYEFLDRNQDLFIGAMWAGIGLHLIKDTGILVGGKKAYVGLPHGLPIEVHQSLQGANAAAAELFGLHGTARK